MGGTLRSVWIRYTKEVKFDCEAMAPAPETEWGPFFVLFWTVYWAGNYDQSTAVEAGSVQSVPDQLVILEGSRDVKDLGPTGTYVDRAKVPQIGPKRLRKGTVEESPAPHSWQGW